jgi:hypothetical protein
MASVGIETRIFEALGGWLAALMFSPVVPIAWPNKAFVSSGTYLRPWLLPAPTEAMTLSAAGPNDYRGIFQVSVFAAVDAGPTAPLETASAIAAHFKRGTRLTRDGINVWMDDPSWVGPMIQEPDVLQLPVSVPYRAFVSNA